MTMSRSRLAVFVALGVALVALVVDRLVLAPSATGPQPAAAAESPPGPAAAAPQPSAGPEALTAAAETDPASTSDGPASLASRLEAAAERFSLDPERLRDGFTPASSWLAELTEPPPSEAAEAAPEPETPSPAEAFRKGHALTAVIMTRSGGSAVVNGRVVRMGQAVDGFTLLRLTRRSAVFASKDGKEVELRLRR